MAYVLVDNFSLGVDRSRPRYVGPNGSLWSGINGHLTRGGDFEKRKAFQATYALPPGQTAGLAKTTAGIFVFGNSAGVSGMPAGVNYQQLAHPTDPALAISSIQSWDLFQGKLYVIAKFVNGDLRHYYDGVNIVDWNMGGTKPTGWGSIVRTHRRKLYSPVGSILWMTQIDTATSLDTTLGASFINMNTHQSGSDAVTALGVFSQQLAVFARRVIQIWAMQDNPANNAPAQFLLETGTRAPRSVIGFGDIDCFYLSDSGIRSLRARYATALAGVNDVGTPIDTLVREFVAALSEATIQSAVALVEPLDSRLWMAVGDRIFVFSYFPSKKISAWSWYEPGVTFTDMVTVNDRVYARAGDQIYLYGGANNATYDDCKVTCDLPFMSAGKPGTFKQVKAVDISSTGTWNMRILINPNDENDYVDVGDISGVTWFREGIEVPAHATHIAPSLVHKAQGYASLSQIGVHTDAAEEKT